MTNCSETINEELNPQLCNTLPNLGGDWTCVRHVHGFCSSNPNRTKKPDRCLRKFCWSPGNLVHLLQEASAQDLYEMRKTLLTPLSSQVHYFYAAIVPWNVSPVPTHLKHISPWQWNWDLRLIPGSFGPFLPLEHTYNAMCTSVIGTITTLNQTSWHIFFMVTPIVLFQQKQSFNAKIPLPPAPFLFWIWNYIYWLNWAFRNF